MPTTIGNSTWTLVDLSTTRTAIPCDHCDRDVKRGFVIQDSDGRCQRVGRGCVKQLTGWTMEWAEAQRILRVAVNADRRATVRAEFPALTDAQVGDIAGQGPLWKTGAWRGMAARFVQINIRSGRLS